MFQHGGVLIGGGGERGHAAETEGGAAGGGQEEIPGQAGGGRRGGRAARTHRQLSVPTRPHAPRTHTRGRRPAPTPLRLDVTQTICVEEGRAPLRTLVHCVIQTSPRARRRRLFSIIFRMYFSMKLGFSMNVVRRPP